MMCKCSDRDQAVLGDWNSRIYSGNTKYTVIGNTKLAMALIIVYVVSHIECERQQTKNANTGIGFSSPSGWR